MLIPETLKKYRFKCKGNPIKTFMNTKTKQANMKQTFQTYKPSASGVKMNPSKGRTTSASTHQQRLSVSYYERVLYGTLSGAIIFDCTRGLLAFHKSHASSNGVAFADASLYSVDLFTYHIYGVFLPQIRNCVFFNSAFKLRIHTNRTD